MKVCLKTLLPLPVLIAVHGLILAGEASAQTFKTLHSFTVTSGYPSYTNSDGATPYGGVTLSNNTLYGTAAVGGTGGYGTVFKMNTDGTGFKVLHNFTAELDQFPRTNNDGAYPNAGLILAGNTLYGTTANGGTNYTGTVFRVATNGAGFINLHSFASLNNDTNSDGFNPGNMVLSGNILYGTASEGGSSSNGTVFAVNTDGTGFKILHSFAAAITFYTNSEGNTYPINSDGANPAGGLVLSGNTLYGTTQNGGSSANGTAYKVNTDGTGFTNLHKFTPTPFTFPYTNADGANPYARLVLSGGTLYGTASAGGSSGGGTVFAVQTNGTGFTNLHRFAGSPGDGSAPYAGLLLSGNTLYGSTYLGGSSRGGTVFKINTDGTALRILHNFTASYPLAGLILSSNTLYGTTSEGDGNGTVFSLSLPPELTIIPYGANVILTWPTNYAGFTLQSATNLGSPVWTTNSPAPVVVNGQNTVTNPISGTQKFYRLSQ